MTDRLFVKYSNADVITEMSRHTVRLLQSSPRLSFSDQIFTTVRFSPTASCSISRSIRLNSNWPETGPTERRPRSVPRSRHPNFSSCLSLSVFRSLAYLCIILSRRRSTLEEEASSPAGQCAVSMEGERRDRFHIRVLTWRGRSLFVHTVLGVLENARKDSRSTKIPRRRIVRAHALC